MVRVKVLVRVRISVKVWVRFRERDDVQMERIEICAILGDSAKFNELS